MSIVKKSTHKPSIFAVWGRQAERDGALREELSPCHTTSSKIPADGTNGAEHASYHGKRLSFAFYKISRKR